MKTCRLAGLVLSIVLCGTTVVSTEQSADPFEATLSRIKHSFDSNSYVELRRELLEGSETSVSSAFGLAILDLYYHRLKQYRAQVVDLPGVDDPANIRKRLLKCIADDRESAYPKAGYAWFVALHREPGLAQPIVRENGTTTFKDATGKVQTAPVFVVVDDPALRDRVAQLAKEAIKLDPKNPLALYLETIKEKDRATRALQLESRLGKPGEYLWELDAIAMILRFSPPEDLEVQKRMKARVAKIAELVGASSPRLAIHKFD